MQLHVLIVIVLHKNFYITAMELNTMDDSKWIGVAKTHELEAEIIRGLLEAQDIQVILSREGAGRAFGLTVGRLGEVEVLVSNKDSEAAKTIILQYKAGILGNQDFDDTQG
jgi:hypothetical protein